jgi:hypothetical protein
MKWPTKECGNVASVLACITLDRLGFNPREAIFSAPAQLLPCEDDYLGQKSGQRFSALTQLLLCVDDSLRREPGAPFQRV